MEISTSNGPACAGETKTIVANLRGVGPVQNQDVTWEWYRNDQPIGNNSAVLQVTEAGIYYVVANSPLCDNADIRSENLSVVFNPAPNNFIITTDPDDSGQEGICSNESISFGVFGDTEGVQFRWLFGDGTSALGPNPTKQYENAGSYIVTVYASRGPCQIVTKTLPITILPSPELNFEEENSFSICLPDTVAPEDTAVTAVITNITPDNIEYYLIDWGDGNGEGGPYVSSPDLFPLEGPEYTELGSYPITITAVGENGCVTTAEYVFNYNQEPKANITMDRQPSGTPPNCTPIIVSLGDSSSGGSLTYKWEIQEPNNGGYEIVYGGLDQDSLQIEFTVPGIFNIQLIVENGCGVDTADQSIIVGYPQAQLPGDVEACGDTTIRYDQQSGVFFDLNFAPANEVTYEWFVDGTLASRDQIPSLTFAAPTDNRDRIEYQVSVRITNGCGTSDDVGAPQPQIVTVYRLPLTPTVATNIEICSGETATIRPAAPGPRYNVYESQFDASPIAPGVQFYTTPPLTQSRAYYVVAVNELGCESEIGAVVNINVRPPIENNVIYVDDPQVCATTGSVTIRGQRASSGGQEPNYRWEISTSGPTAGFSAAEGNNSLPDYEATALNQRVWFRRVAYIGDCIHISDPVELIINTAPAAPIVPGNVVVCADNPTGTIEVVPVPGNSLAEWYLTPTGGIPDQVTNSFPLEGITQTVTYYVQVTGENGCPSTRTPVTITVVTAQANAGEDVEIIQNRKVQLQATGGATYVWEPATGLSNPNVANPIASPQETTTYTVTVTTREGCVATDEVTVTVTPAIIVPNAFSPNRDGINEVWQIDNIESFPDVRVEIFNRWGSLIFSSNGYGTPWDGTYNGKDLPVATYYYMIYLNSSEKPISGHVTIIR
ncbi:gliding motility-associated C-terminal domain-containing protein [Pontibacter sp. SGAir0037]|uniref:Ig-like domain-containing protein n=1 Tax=Pontibacter sp. SGAir0037 TaxID=2571030 RepID=UPI00143CF171|nr:gliding motility-associated C-terminal domain-containing protein [Pontibacter sp. SGAir0037]